MLRLLKSVLVLGILFVSFIPLALALSVPAPKGYVNDFGNLLSPQMEESLESQLTEFEKKTSHEIVVATIPDLQSTTIEDFSVQLFEQWGIGKEGKDNGALLLVSAKEREVRIEVGYGLEPVITDGDAGNIIRTILIPEFRNGQFDKGITRGTQALMQIAQGEKVDFPRVDREEEVIAFGPFIFFAIGILQYIGAFLARTKSWYAGGIIGGVIGVILSSVLTMSLTNAAAVVGILAILGTLLDFILSKNYQYRKSHNLPTSWGKSGGGFWFGGSSSRDGGFGGFGGGRSGGGGSSGRW